MNRFIAIAALLALAGCSTAQTARVQDRCQEATALASVVMATPAYAGAPEMVKAFASAATAGTMICGSPQFVEQMAQVRAWYESVRVRASR